MPAMPEANAYGPDFADALNACVDRVVERTEGKEECLECLEFIE